MRTRIVAIFFCIPLLIGFLGCSSNEEKAVKYIARGDRLIEAGDSMRAILEYKNALQLDPKSSAAQFALGKAHLSRKEYVPAYRSLNAALELNPNLDEARVEVATLLSAGSPKRPSRRSLKSIIPSLSRPRSLSPRQLPTSPSSSRKRQLKS